MKTKTFIPVQKTSRTGQFGRNIQCPHCQAIDKVYHFAWYSLQCNSWKQVTNKTDYLMETK